MQLFTLVSIGIFAAFANADTFCPLCGEDAVIQSPPIPNSGEVTFDFGMCCPFSDGPADDCIVNPTGEAARESSLSAPITEGEDYKDFCLTFDNFLFEKTDGSTCCQTCSCYGDPNCVSFDGTKETWVVCDARQVPEIPLRESRSFCPLTKAQCDKETDAFGNACVWQPPLKGIDEDDWSVYKYGSPCKPTGPSSILMYQADSFGFEILQEERGWVVGVDISLGEQHWTMSAEECVQNSGSGSWNGPMPLPDYFARYEEQAAPGQFPDVIWKIRDPATNIGVVIRCTSNKFLAAKFQPRMNIESISEAEELSQRSNLDGFCYTNTLGNTNPSPNTQLIEENGYCSQNAASDNVTIARIICSNPSITANGVDQCKQDFCSQYYMGYYDSFDDCYSAILQSWEGGFCGAFTDDSLDFDECVTATAELGWQVATNYYYNLNRPSTSNNGDCISDFNELPDALEPCEGGVLLQTYNPLSKEWETLKAVSEKRPLCVDASFELCIDDVPELFNRRIRWLQDREVEGCLVDECAKQTGFFVRLTTQKETHSPTKAPSKSPTTSEPTRIPTGSPVTSTPTTSPSASPTTSEPTKNPTTTPTTSEPSVSPTPAPSVIPSAAPSIPTALVLPPTDFIAVCPEDNVIPIELSEENLRYNNLGGQGPRVNDTCPFMWYDNALTVDGVSVNVVVRVFEGEYTPSNTDLNPEFNDGVINNGIFGELGQINLACDAKVYLEFLFIRSDCGIPDCDVATNTECDIVPSVGEGLVITTYDIDEHFKGRNKESVSYCNVDQMLFVQDSQLDVSTNTDLECDNALKFTSTKFGDGTDNPTIQKISDLSRSQRQKVGQVRVLEDQTRVQALYEVSGPDFGVNPSCGRRILFSGDYCSANEQIPTN